MANLFQHYTKQTAILLVDASGSTNCEFKSNAEPGGPQATVFDTMLTVCSQLGHSQYRVLFWNSARSGPKFPNGVNVIPFVVKPDNLGLAFLAVKSEIRQTSFTNTDLAFSNIPPEWLRDDPTIYLVTDGDIQGHDIDGIKRRLRAEIENLQCRLNIVTVEPKLVDLRQQENLEGVAGSDVYKLIQEAKLTRKVTQFVSHTLPLPNANAVETQDARFTRFVHINRNDPPKGFVPYEEKYFSEFHVPDFYNFVAAELKNADETKQIRVAQNLANTLSYLTKDKPERLASDIIANFARLFTIDANMIQFILSEAIDRERQGIAGVFANYRKDLKDLYKEAGKMLSKRVNSAIGLDARTRFVSCPIGGRILVGNGLLVNRSLLIGDGIYPKSSYECVPVFPIFSMEGKRTDIQEQCVRQWMRAVFGFLHHATQTSDEIIYLMLGQMLIVNKSPNITDEVKRAYVELARIALRKKRMNSMQTEFERLESGELPIPNTGKINDFFLMMYNVAKKLKIETKSMPGMRLWHEICGVLGGKVAERQQPHCRTIVEDWSEEIKLPTYEMDTIPDSFNLDYTCLVTLEDISGVGGYRINLHHRPGLSDCYPVYLFSETGKTQLVNSQNCACPVCFTVIRPDEFTKVGPKTEFKLHAAFEATPFVCPPTKEQKEQQDVLSALAEQDLAKRPTPLQAEVPVKSGNMGKLVVLRGVVGSGKTTVSERIRQKVESRGGTCWVEGTDKYCTQGMDMVSAVQRARESLCKAIESDAKDKVVVIDTCGEHNNGKRVMKYFDVDFKGWDKIALTPHFDESDKHGYLAWSLWNVLKRSRNKPDSNYYLNPESASVMVCIQVHEKKAKSLGWKSAWNFDHVRNAESVEPEARQYRVPEVDLCSI